VERVGEGMPAKWRLIACPALDAEYPGPISLCEVFHTRNREA
jgi:hypothetical protein